MHTGRSGDSRTPPAVVHAWYEARGYDFITFTDHNVVTDTPDTKLVTIPGVELTQNLRTCDPPPAAGDACLLHVNVLFVSSEDVSALLRPPDTASRKALYRHALDVSDALGGLPMLNHPNLHFGATADIVADLSTGGLQMMEIENMAWDSRNAGDAIHPSTEAIWDDVLGRGLRVWGTVTDDAHHYDDADQARARGEDVFVGDLGFVAVRALKEPNAIRSALERGDFYGSTGVVLEKLELSPSRCVIEVAGDDDVSFEVVSTGGAVVERSTGRALFYEPRPKVGKYVRFRIRNASGKLALTQPVML